MTKTRAFEILLVENDPIDARLTVEALKESNSQINLRIAKDGVEALAYLRRQGQFTTAPKPDLVLLDLNLPKKSGFEVLAELKNDPVLKRIPVLILTTSEAREDIISTYDLHANCFITKPIDLEHFIKMLKSVRDFWFNIAKLPPA